MFLPFGGSRDGNFLDSMKAPLSPLVRLLLSTKKGSDAFSKMMLYDKDVYVKYKNEYYKISRQRR